MFARLKCRAGVSAGPDTCGLPARSATNRQSAGATTAIPRQDVAHQHARGQEQAAVALEPEASIAVEFVLSDPRHADLDQRVRQVRFVEPIPEVDDPGPAGKGLGNRDRWAVQKVGAHAQSVRCYKARVCSSRRLVGLTTI